MEHADGEPPTRQPGPSVLGGIGSVVESSEQF
jgi:hypothetical protein